MAAKKNDKKKIYVIDTNVFISDPDCLGMFDDNIVIVPSTVIEELDDNKKAPGDKGYNARQAIRNIDLLIRKGDLTKGIPTANGGMIRVQTDCGDVKLPETWKDKPDNYILKISKYLSETEKLPVTIVSNDTNVRVKASVIGVNTEEYRHEMVDEDYLKYNGRGTIFLSAKDFGEFASGNPVPVKKAKFEKKEKNKTLVENQFLIITDNTTMGTKLGMVRNGMIQPLRFEKSHPYGITPRNSAQKFCIEALMAPANEIPLVILKGSAGTAKTFLTLACALQQCAEEPIYRKITITRANVEFDKDIGALPGDEESKVGPLLRGCMDNLEILVDSDTVKKNKGNETDLKGKIDYLLDKGYISVEALGFLRGRSLTRQILFVDEAQNTSISQMKGILTRVGEGTKLVIAGDLNQIDNPRLDKRNNGLAYAIKLMSGDSLCCLFGFTDEETTRSPLAARVASLI